MVSLTESAPAKVNFALDILGKRNDGYHEMRMINHVIRLADELSFSDSDQIAFSCDDPIVPTGKDNLIVQTAVLIKKKFDICRGVRIALKKKIPMEAGLGGGSADAAATIRGLNRLWQLGMTRKEMCDVGAQIGADVPYCISGGTALVEGFGERITDLRDFPEMKVLVVKPPIAVSTPLAFKMSDQWPQIQHLDMEGLTRAVNAGDWTEACSLAGNSFERPVFDHWPEIESIKKKCSENGAMYTTMSGSGSTVVAYFYDPASAEKAVIAFKDDPVYVTLSEIWNNRG